MRFVKGGVAAALLTVLLSYAAASVTKKTPRAASLTVVSAPNCAACVRMKKVVTNLQKAGYDVSVVDYRDKNAPEGVRACPTLVFYGAPGVESSRHVGYLPYKDVVKLLGGRTQ